MSNKRALIVDDSKSARVILSRMLEKYGIEVDMAESAEQAIEYLQRNLPDAIFMDHLMPGMDGLQAVQAIKGNSRTAMIPIMMYTSQEGELYVGQARALGAMGVLPKQVRPVDVSKVLYELHMLPDRRDAEDSALMPVELNGGGGLKAAAPVPAAGVGADWGRRLEAAVKEQTMDLRRFVVASLDSFASRIVSDLRNLPPARPTVDAPLASAPPPRRARWAWPAVAGAACLAAAAFGVLWTAARNDLAHARVEAAGLAAANIEITRDRAALADTVKRLTSALADAAAGGPAGSGSAQPNGSEAASGVTAAGGTYRGVPKIQSVLVPYGEVPLGRGRFDLMRDLLTKLVAAGFRGVVAVSSSAGLFCLTGNAMDGYVPASPTLPLGKCDAIGNPIEDSLSGQQRQSLEFGNLIASVRQRTGGAISVTIEDTPPSSVAVPYPARTDTLTAGEWNKAAAANNRVEFAVKPAGAR